MTDALIEVEGLRLRRGRFELRIDHWEVRPGEIVGLVGPNGSGKTTLLHMLHGIFPPTEGTVRVLGRDPWRDPVYVRSRVGYAAEEIALFPLKPRALLATLAGYYPGFWDDGLADELTGRFALPDKPVDGLSRGEGMRVRLVAAMAFRPTVLLLDEPSNGLDLGHKLRLMETLLEVVKEEGRSVVISSHLLPDVERVADRLLVLGEGRVVGDGPTDELVGDGRTLEEAMVAWGVAG